MRRTVRRTSVFPADIHTVFAKLQKLETLQKIASPYASFTPVSSNDSGQWQAGGTSSYRFRLFGLIPFGIHTIHVIRFDEGGIYTHEGNEHVPVWNHRIILKPLPEKCCEYTDEVEIGAGWKTLFVYWWACAFYAHRQRKWIRMLAEESKEV